MISISVRYQMLFHRITDKNLTAQHTVTAPIFFFCCRIAGRGRIIQDCVVYVTLWNTKFLIKFPFKLKLPKQKYVISLLIVIIIKWKLLKHEGLLIFIAGERRVETKCVKKKNFFGIVQLLLACLMITNLTLLKYERIYLLGKMYKRQCQDLYTRFTDNIVLNEMRKLSSGLVYKRLKVGRVKIIFEILFELFRW